MEPWKYQIIAKFGWARGNEILFDLKDDEIKSFSLLGFKNKLLWNLFIFGIPFLGLVFSFSIIRDYIIFALTPTFLIFFYDLTFGRKKYLTFAELKDNLSNDDNKIATSTWQAILLTRSFLYMR